jgi:hypothetical protein
MRRSVRGADVDAADRARDQFDRVDPKNRLVADTLEARWNALRTALAAARGRLAEAEAAHGALTAKQRERIRALGRDFAALWTHPQADPALKKRLLRTAVCEIVVTQRVEAGELEAVVHWQGGAHTQLAVPKRARPTAAARGALADTVRRLAATLGDAELASVLNLQGVPTAGELPWSKGRVRDFRRQERILAPAGPCDDDRLTGQQAAAHLGVSRNALLALIKRGVVDPQQAAPYAALRISRRALDAEPVQSIVTALKADGRLPKGVVSRTWWKK